MDVSLVKQTVKPLLANLVILLPLKPSTEAASLQCFASFGEAHSFCEFVLHFRRHGQGKLSPPTRVFLTAHPTESVG